MPPAAAGASLGLLLSAGLLVLAGVFAVRQWRDRRGRDPSLSVEDARYFAGQDVRRLAGSVVMGLLATGILLGIRLVPPRGDRAAGRLFGWVWVLVALLVLVLLGLALWDWLAITGYARRHRRALAAERLAALVEERRKLAAPRNGRGRPDGPTVP